MSYFNTLNKVMLIGRLGRDPEKKYSNNNIAICNFSLATSERIKRGDSYEEKTEWHRIVVFGNQAENVSRFVKKGSLVFVEGRIQTRTYQDKEGNEKYVTEIVANSVTFLDPKEQGNVSSERMYQSTAPQEAKHGTNSPAASNSAPVFDNDDEDLPF